MNKAGKRISIREKAKAIKREPRKIWFDSLSKDQKAEMLDFRDGWRAGEISAPITVVRREVVLELLGDKCPTAPTLSRWLRDSDD
jgi:hypothetical protein